MKVPGDRIILAFTKANIVSGFLLDDNGVYHGFLRTQ